MIILGIHSQPYRVRPSERAQLFRGAFFSLESNRAMSVL